MAKTKLYETMKPHQNFLYQKNIISKRGASYSWSDNLVQYLTERGNKISYYSIQKM